MADSADNVVASTGQSRKPRAYETSGQRNDRGYRLIEHIHDLPLEEMNSDGGRDPSPKRRLSGYGRPRDKAFIEKTDVFALLSCLVLFIAAFVTVSPSTSTPWKLGLTRQFQVIGFLLSAMNLCFLSIAPKIFVLLEARFGPSYLQNYDAILRNSFVKTNTNIVWRGLLVTVTVVPVALSLAYKEFNHGRSHNTLGNHTGNFYGLLPAAGLEDRFVGLTFFENTTVSFTSATFADPPLPSFPSPYGFNTLLLSNTSSAKLDAPSPKYVRHIQTNLISDETYNLTADVLATVTTYNSSVETHRNDDQFWNHYLSLMHDPPNKYINQSDASDKDAYLVSKLTSQDLYTGKWLSMLVNSLYRTDTSWMFFAITPPNATEFRRSARLYHTRRESCTGTWRITYNSIELVHGLCNKPPLSDDRQKIFTNATFALPEWYMPSLSEHLGPLTAPERANSPWLLPTYCTLFAGMYWSRITAFNTKSLFDYQKTTEQDIDSGPDPNRSPDDYYHVADKVTSSRRTMNASPGLYVTLAIYPILTALFFTASLLLHNVPLDSGFGTIALLAGVRVETLSLLEGASRSGRLRKPIRVAINADERRVEGDGGTGGRNEYILHDEKVGWRGKTLG
ncbi:uncharacterized protein KY384_008896 [Bacidia gigantensis]|uniref:uncharacterized protein n=1 Tax=Bacidia gigantensis TaxID=2732470 RepID=UPI001D0462E4|nr:uncharacterized protein KY384_008896 [Bacidia gigantensis]KAG8525252.1 hypothetical protein KY384_008896 [Bacidia gigantensis]